MDTDATKSLAQLTGIDWGAAPDSAGSLVRDRHEYRQTPLGSLSIPALRRLLSLDFQDDCAYLIPYSLQRISRPPPADADGFSHYCNLLLGVLLNERYDWLQRPELVGQARRLVETTCYALYCASGEAEQTSDHLEYYRVLLPNTQMRASLYEALAHFEQRLSKVEPLAAANEGLAAPLANSEVMEGPPSVS
jgi:hypothetical protein